MHPTLGPQKKSDVPQLLGKNARKGPPPTNTFRGIWVSKRGSQTGQGHKIGIPIAWYKARIPVFPEYREGKDQVVFSGEDNPSQKGVPARRGGGGPGSLCSTACEVSRSVGNTTSQVPPTSQDYSHLRPVLRRNFSATPQQSEI